MRRLALLAMAGAVLLAVPAPADAGPRSKRTAQALSGVGTGASAALFLSAFLFRSDGGEVNMPLLYAGLGSGVITPSLGHFYVGDYLTIGMGIRAGAAALATYAVLEHSQPVRCPGVGFDTSCTSLEREAIALLGLAAIALVGGAAYDLKELPDRVESYNRRNGFILAPVMMPTSTGAPGAGLALTGTW